MGYIVDFGTEKQNSVCVKQINKAFEFIGINIPEIVIVDGVYNETLETRLWIILPKSKK